MAEATIELKLTEHEKQELVERTAADVVRRLAFGIVAHRDAPRIGEVWQEQGGVYAGIIRPEDGAAAYHLIVASGSDGEASDMAWGAYGESEPGAESKWDGKANTTALARSYHDHPAAEWASGLQINGHADWYLPAQRELMLCWVNTPELFAKEWHWSSTQFSSGGAWTQGFTTGSTYIRSKGYE